MEAEELWNDLSDNQKNEVFSFLSDGQNIKAVHFLREAKGWGLRDSKTVMEYGIQVWLSQR